ncbi:hypothetical protein BMS3Abin04_01911 [bacterium BMS3Abin04]|nr:hypothetical protein BMS3Abin04_01911 [bacterium BMS3Abin04]
MNERFIILMEKFFENELDEKEKLEFDSLLLNDHLLKKEFEEQKRIKEVLDKMKLKNPSKEFWDGYWTSLYNKLERGIAWIAISIGALILIAYGSIQAVNQFFADKQTPLIVQIGTVALVFGIIVLIFSVVREKYFTSKHDKYKEIQR